MSQQFAVQQAKAAERKTHAIGVAGSAVGIVGFTFMGEFITGAFGLSGGQKFLASAGAKVLLGVGALMAMGAATGGMSLFLLAVGWSGLGSIAIDALQYLYPSAGVFSLAEDAAAAVRGEASVAAQVEEAIAVKRARLTSSHSAGASKSGGQGRVTVVSS